MNTIVTTSQMKNIDFRTINEFGTPARVLMEMAGKGCADTIADMLGIEKLSSTIILCGHGNNGGDGAVIARWLRLYDFDIDIIVLVVGKGNMSPETQANLKQCKDLGIDVLECPEEEQAAVLLSVIKAGAVVIDAIFGIGFKGTVNEHISNIFQIVNNSGALVVAIDIPSGMDADTGICQSSINAHHTLAIGSYKYGHFVGPNSDRCGELMMIDIGFPPAYYVDEGVGAVLEERDLETPPRDPRGHKGTFGKVYIFGGIQGFTGAAVLAARAALRSGAGYVYVMHRPELGDLYAQKLTEALCVAIPESQPGIPDTKAILKILENADCVLIGPGFGKDDYSYTILNAVLQGYFSFLVVDADALNIISEHRELLPHVEYPTVLLTPHWGEFCRLAECTMEELSENFIQILFGFVEEYKTKVLLKSHFTVYHDRDRTILATSGNDGLATGGSGDVLAGIIASFKAQGMGMRMSSINASLLMGKTASHLAKKRGTPSILPSDIIDNLFVMEEV
jgi:NAD(P)H-hydrate epimerase